MKLSENISYLHYFGLKVTFYKTLHRLNRSNDYLRHKNDRVIEEYLLKCIPNSSYNLKNNKLEVVRTKNNEVKINDTIWTIWWQGEENAPYIVKECINSMREHSKGHKVIVIDKSNYEKYIDIPNYVLSRYKNGKEDKSLLKNIVLSKPLLSDIIRCGILAAYGGVWADSTIFFAKDIDESIFKREWYTLGQDDKKYVGEGKWSTFFFECKRNNSLVEFIFAALCEYWKKENYYINYLMFDYLIDEACKCNSDIDLMINKTTNTNSKPLTINRNYNRIVTNEKRIDNFITKQTFHKLSYKWWLDGNTPVESSNGRKTIYGFLKEKYF